MKLPDDKHTSYDYVEIINSKCFAVWTISRDSYSAFGLVCSDWLKQNAKQASNVSPMNEYNDDTGMAMEERYELYKDYAN